VAASSIPPRPETVNRICSNLKIHRFVFFCWRVSKEVLSNGLAFSKFDFDTNIRKGNKNKRLSIIILCNKNKIFFSYSCQKTVFFSQCIEQIFWIDFFTNSLKQNYKYWSWIFSWVMSNICAYFQGHSP
jgi:hypothetical protein